MNAHSYRSVQRACLGVLGSFILLVSVIVFSRSMGRQSLVFRDDSAYNSAVAPPTSGGSELHLQEFHRVEVKNGKKMWEVRAHDARYFPADSIVQVNDAEVMVYQTKGEPVGFRAKSARLLLAGDSLQSAELEGNVIVQVTSTVNFQTEVALYDSKDGSMSAPGAVNIKGDGFSLTGEGLALSIPDQVIRINQNVSSQFESGAKLPSSLASRVGN